MGMNHSIFHTVVWMLAIVNNWSEYSDRGRGGCRGVCGWQPAVTAPNYHKIYETRPTLRVTHPPHTRKCHCQNIKIDRFCVSKLSIDQWHVWVLMVRVILSLGRDAESISASVMRRETVINLAANILMCWNIYIHQTFKLSTNPMCV